MIVDDSTVYRNLLRTVLESDSHITVVSQAPNGKLALPRLRHYNPDFVILDQEMPEMSGLELLAIIRRDFRNTKVIMFSSHTLTGAMLTIKALEKGAIDFVTKPEFSTDADVEEYIKSNLCLRIRRIHAQGRAETRTKAPVKPGVATPDKLRQAYDLCAIGISTGGPTALREFLAQIPAEIQGSILIVQHMPPIFTKQLAESLDRHCDLVVGEATAGEKPLPGHVYIAPGGKHLVVRDTDKGIILQTLDTPPENNCKPAVDILFRSIAESSLARRSVCLIMTGMGYDGYEGMKVLKPAGAYLLAQTAESCVVFGMPARPTEEGLVEEALDISGLAARVKFLLGV